jgi:hypothetical protein
MSVQVVELIFRKGSEGPELLGSERGRGTFPGYEYSGALRIEMTPEDNGAAHPAVRKVSAHGPFDGRNRDF